LTGPLHFPVLETASERTVDLWYGDLDRLPVPDSVETLLAPEEIQRALRFRQEIHARRFIRARWCLRMTLGTYLSIPPQEIRLRYAESGKPAMEENEGPGFNLSHSENLIVIGVGPGPVGVDVELVRPRVDVEKVAERVFTRQEREGLARDLSPGDPSAFFRLWTGKEAFLKGIGSGFSDDPKRWELRPASFGYQGRRTGGPEPPWSVLSFSISSELAGRAGYGAVAVPGPPPNIKLRSLDSRYPPPGRENKLRP
jgi:4'-phosphopantetheinyl transferase